jgi:hypothetical protein
VDVNVRSVGVGRVKGAEKWRKEHIPRKGKGNISAEGQEFLEDKEIWGNETTLREAIYDSRHSLPTGSSGRPGTRTRADGRMDEDDLGQITGSKENVTDKLSYVPNKFLDTQDHERPRI